MIDCRRGGKDNGLSPGRAKVNSQGRKPLERNLQTSLSPGRAKVPKEYRNAAIIRKPPLPHHLQHEDDVKKYIANQNEHHRVRSFQEEFVAFLERHDIPYDERYIWE